MAQAARDELAATLAPAGVLAEVRADEFATVYAGAGDNAPRTPVAEIYPRADRLALFAVTCGRGVGARIEALFAADDYPLAAALDAAASLAADRAAQAAQDRFAALCPPAAGVLRYSPGYCGWNVTGQRALFARLGDAAAGITLTDSCLMNPLKSVSGVIVAGPAGIHDFDDDFPFCQDCADHECRARIDRMRAAAAEGG